MTTFFGRLLVSVGLTIGVVAPAAAGPRTTLSFTTFNIRWYGLNGSASGQVGSESRDATIRKHLEDYGLLTDVLAFQEIVDVAGLTRILGAEYSCESYDHPQPRHQHVVVCVKGALRFVKAEDDNFIMEDVSLEHHRPAVHGWVTTSRGRKLAHFIAVHLKAMPDETATRLTQIEIIGDALANMSVKLPTIITGDFNTYEDESSQMHDRFLQRDLGLAEVEFPEPYTFRTSRYQSKFDRVYASGLTFTTTPQVVGPCNGTPTRQELDRYYDEVSDHCAVTWTVRMPEG